MYAAQSRYEDKSLPIENNLGSYVGPKSGFENSKSQGDISSRFQFDSVRRIQKRSTPLPRLVRSVVDEAGLGRFVYLQGKSGRRYVFSSIRSEQVALYEHAIFAISDPGCDEVRVVDKVCNINSVSGMLFVHLLDVDSCNAATAMNDLGTTN